jgi:hypothetical protein
MAELKRHMDVLERVLAKPSHSRFLPNVQTIKLPHKTTAEKRTYE